jgi:hypothetical protein
LLAAESSSFAAMVLPDKPLDALLGESLGAQKAAALLDTICKGTRYTRSYLLRYRPDLSYVPAR